MLNEFKKFILRGNVVDLAVGIVIGAAFTTLANTFVRTMITPLIAAVWGQRDFSKHSFTINNSQFLYGDLINALITFFIVAVVVFFFVVQPINKLSILAFKSKTTDEEATRKCPYCLGTVPSEATKCMHCTSEIKKETAEKKS